MIFENTTQIASDLLEQQYQHLHHADILRVLENARLQFLEHIGVPQAKLLEEDCFLVLSKCDVQFLREIKEEELIARVEFKSLLDESSFVLSQELLKKPKRIAVRATIELVAMSAKTRRRRALHEELRRVLVS